MKLPGNRKSLLRKIILTVMLVVTPAVFAADRDRMNDLGDRLMCMCGCGQLLVRCNHTDCRKSVPMIKELAAQIDAGGTDQQILATFVDKYGRAVLSDGGGMKFVPYLVLLGGAIVAVAVVVRWKRAVALAQPAAAAIPEDAVAAEPSTADAEYRRRAEEDLKKISPED